MCHLTLSDIGRGCYISPDRFKTFITVYIVLKSAYILYDFPIYTSTNLLNKNSKKYLQKAEPKRTEVDQGFIEEEQILENLHAPQNSANF